MITVSSYSPAATAGIIGLAITVPIVLGLLVRFLIKVVITSRP